MGVPWTIKYQQKKAKVYCPGDSHGGARTCPKVIDSYGDFFEAAESPAPKGGNARIYVAIKNNPGF
jgi:hypothetical protein